LDGVRHRSRIDTARSSHARSPSTLRLAVKALRTDFAARLRRQLPEMEQLYLDELMKTPDAVEGLRAFLEKRSPRWQ